MIINICDDDRIFLDYLYKQVEQAFSDKEDVEIYKLAPEELLQQIEGNVSSLPCDILITDIDLGDLNGIQLARKINEINPACLIIFVSNYINYATEVYDVDHIYFVLKTDTELRLPKALQKAFEAFHESKANIMTVSYQGVEHIIALSDILYVEAMGRYLYIHTDKESFKCIKSLKAIVPELDDSFAKSHKSYIINLKYIKSLSRNSCTLINGTAISISNTYNKEFQKVYMRYISKKLS